MIGEFLETWLCLMEGWREQGLPQLSGRKWLVASPGEQKANSSDPALLEEKRSQSTPTEVTNKRQHVLNAQEIPPFCGKKTQKLYFAIQQTWFWRLICWRNLNSKFLDIPSQYMQLLEEGCVQRLKQAEPELTLIVVTSLASFLCQGCPFSPLFFFLVLFSWLKIKRRKKAQCFLFKYVWL